MIFSVSELETWRRCRKQWSLTSDWQGNLEPIVMAPALQLGGMVQLCLSQWTLHPDEDPARLWALLSAETLEKAHEVYESKIGAPMSDPEIDMLNETILLGHAMVSNYRDYYKSPLPKGYKLARPEERFVVEIPNTKHWECPDHHILSGGWDEHSVSKECPGCKMPCTWQSHFLRATLDSLVFDQQDHLHVLERKTYKQRPTYERLRHNYQMLAYRWVLGCMFEREQIGGVLYDGLWKRAVPPSRRSKSDPPYTIADLFYREVFLRRSSELIQFETELTNTVNEAGVAICNNIIYTNRIWQGCWDCKVEAICSAISMGEDVEYIINTRYKQRDGNPSLIGPDIDDDENV